VRLNLSEIQIQEEQRTLCGQYSAEFTAAPGEVKSGLALSTKGLLPINGLRNPPTDETTGWYIWCGERYSEDSDFFEPLCTSHIYGDEPEIAKFLGLPPGYRFLLAGDYSDVWYDESLLDI
jgi:hypothetical protein